MAKYLRTPDMEYKMTLDGICGRVELDLNVEILNVSGKLKAYSPKLKSYLQFPHGLRKRGAKFIVDAVHCQHGSSTPFYRAYKGSIRDLNNEVVG